MRIYQKTFNLFYVFVTLIFAILILLFSKIEFYILSYLVLTFLFYLLKMILLRDTENKRLSILIYSPMIITLLSTTLINLIITILQLNIFFSVSINLILLILYMFLLLVIRFNQKHIEQNQLNESNDFVKRVNFELIIKKTYKELSLKLDELLEVTKYIHVLSNEMTLKLEEEIITLIKSLSLENYDLTKEEIILKMNIREKLIKNQK
jgi:hypothetical protein